MKLCIPHDVDAFVFNTERKYSQPERRRGHDARIASAKAICARCPERGACLEEELQVMRDGGKTYGIYGQTTASERNALLNGDIGARELLASRRAAAAAESAALRQGAA